MKFLADENVESAVVTTLRVSREKSSKKATTIKHLFKYHKEKLKGHFTVINEHQIKIRPM